MIVVAGKQSTDTDANFLIVRFKSNGDVDDTFGDRYRAYRRSVRRWVSRACRRRASRWW
jgi:hypothetical protein